MENNGLLQLILDELKGLRGDVNVLKEDVSVLKEDVTGLKEDVAVLKEDVAGLKEDVSTLKVDVFNLKEGQKRIERKLDAVYEQTAELTEFRTETRQQLGEIKDTLKFLLYKSSETEKEIHLLKQKKF